MHPTIQLPLILIYVTNILNISNLEVYGLVKQRQKRTDKTNVPLNLFFD